MPGTRIRQRKRKRDRDPSWVRLWLKINEPALISGYGGTISPGKWIKSAGLYHHQTTVVDESAVFEDAVRILEDSS